MKPLVIYIFGSRLMCKTLFAALLLLQNIGQRESFGHHIRVACVDLISLLGLLGT